MFLLVGDNRRILGFWFWILFVMILLVAIDPVRGRAVAAEYHFCDQNGNCVECKREIGEQKLDTSPADCIPETPSGPYYSPQQENSERFLGTSVGKFDGK
jgi:hypothetical protein